MLFMIHKMLDCNFFLSALSFYGNAWEEVLPKHFVPFPESPSGQEPHLKSKDGAGISVQLTPVKHGLFSQGFKSLLQSRPV